jgi:class 3 adenylate cyclase/tetratricopeptide (TPR) repeat protein
VLFVDLVGSTALVAAADPEVVRRRVTKFFELVSGCIEAHGGTVEKFAGDAVMAAFGVPLAHEDDAERALRAALEIRAGVGVECRIGVEAGEVVSEDADSTFATGHAVTVAARLQQAAEPGEVLVGAAAHRLAAHAVELESAGRRGLGGVSEPVPVWRAVSASRRTGRSAGAVAAPLIGRGVELALLRNTLDRTVRDRRAHLVTIYGEPGVGKSRLARDFVAGLEGVRVLVGRCLPYGEGITYWPLAQMVRQAAGIDEADTAQAAVSKLATLTRDGAVTERVGQAIGLLDTSANADETPWAVRQLLETIASARPLVCICDDIQWAEPALLDLLQEVAAHSHGSPILICCLARPELLELRPDWPGVIRLHPLSEADADELLVRLAGERMLPAAVRDRIATAAAGNPLFIEQFVAMLIDEGMLAEGGTPPEGLPVPPTLQALLTARLERLAPDERQVLTRAAVAGQTIYLGALRELVPAPVLPDLERILLTLVRKDLLLPARSDLATESAYQFRHLLIRDTAYEVLTKEDRAELHECFGRWLEQVLAERPDEVEEIVGHHLEQAHRFRAELAPLDERGRALADEAAERLAASGRRAAGRGDSRAAARLFSRAAALLDIDDVRRPDLLIDAAGQLRVTGLYDEAAAAADEGVALRPEERLATRARLALLRIRFESDPDLDLGVLATEARKAAVLADELDDHILAAEAWGALADVSWARCRFEATAEADTRAAEHAERAGNPMRTRLKLLKLNCAASGPMPTSQAIALGEQTLEALNRQPTLASGVLTTLGHLHAMRGEFELARRLVLRGLAMRDEGTALAYAGRTGSGWEVEARSGNWEAAEREIRAGYEGLVALGNTGFGATAAATLGHCLVVLGRMDEAEELVAVSRETATAEDVVSQVAWRNAQARLLAARGEPPEAVKVAKEAVELALATDALSEQGEALVILAEVLVSADLHDEARTAARQALDAFDRKEHLVGAARAERLLARIENRASQAVQ